MFICVCSYVFANLPKQPQAHRYCHLIVVQPDAIVKLECRFDFVCALGEILSHKEDNGEVKFYITKDIIF